MVWTPILTRNGTPPAIVRGGWLDALRVIAATLIVLHHFQGSAPVPLAEGLHPVFERGGFLVTNFFLIDSGYVLMRVYGASVARGATTAGDFFARRFLRVYPAHLLMGLGLVALVVAGSALGAGPSHPEWFAWDQLPAQLTLTQAFGVHGGLGWNAPSWSISALIGCYLAFPWMLRALVRMEPWAALFLAVALYLAANQATLSLLGYPVYQMPMRYGFIRALPLFVFGMALAWFAQNVWIAPRRAAVIGWVAAAGIVAAQACGKNALVTLACIGLVILAAGAVPTPRPSRLIERGAQAAFAVFITNEVVRIAWFGAADLAAQRLALPVAAQWGLWALGVASAFAFAWVFHLTVDQPIQDAVRRMLKRGRRLVAVGPVVSLEG